MEPCLPDDLLLLALDHETGMLAPAAPSVRRALPAALAAAVLLELGLRGRLHNRPDGTVTIVGESTGDPILDDMARRISRMPFAYSADTWVKWLASDVPNLQELLAEGLVAKGVLRRRGHTVRWLLRTRRYPLADAVAGRQIRETVRAVLVDENATPDARTLALLTLVRTANLEESLVDGVLAERTLRERRQARQRVEMLTGADRLQAFPCGLSGALVGAVAAGALAYLAAQSAHEIIAADATASTGADGSGQTSLDGALNVGNSLWDALFSGDGGDSDGGGD
jgi:hypothetical protein